MLGIRVFSFNINFSRYEKSPTPRPFLILEWVTEQKRNNFLILFIFWYNKLLEITTKGLLWHILSNTNE